MYGPVAGSEPRPTPFAGVSAGTANAGGERACRGSPDLAYAGGTSPFASARPSRCPATGRSVSAPPRTPPSRRCRRKQATGKTSAMKSRSSARRNPGADAAAVRVADAGADAECERRSGRRSASAARRRGPARAGRRRRRLRVESRRDRRWSGSSSPRSRNRACRRSWALAPARPRGGCRRGGCARRADRDEEAFARRRDRAVAVRRAAFA